VTSGAPTAADSGAGNEPVLQVRDLHVEFATDDGLVRAVRGVSFDLRPGRVLAVVGESGSGKSVTALAILGLLPKGTRITGSARFGDRELLGMAAEEIVEVRGEHVAMIFQDPMTSLNPVHRVGDQISEAVLAHHPELGKETAREMAVRMLGVVGIPEPELRAGMFPHEYSGGMRQRAMIALAIVNDPAVLIADEPTTALDVTVQAQVLEALQAAQQEAGAAMLLITHDLGVVAGTADDVLVMYAGRPVETGTVDQVFYEPRMPYTLGLLGSLPRVDADGDLPLTPIPGTPPSMLGLRPGCPFAPRCPLVIDRCRQEEPPLAEVGDTGQQAACWRSDELGPGVDPTDVFTPGAVADRGLAATSPPSAADREPSP
jgi:oligopeptide/dipeptide ABC transporter ATP-binding protein